VTFIPGCNELVTQAVAGWFQQRDPIMAAFAYKDGPFPHRFPKQIVLRTRLLYSRKRNGSRLMGCGVDSPDSRKLLTDMREILYGDK